jgi:hypothetical protein
MDGKILDHYKQFSLFTNPGLYKDILAKELPDDVVEIGKLVKMNMIHRMMLAMGNTGPNADLKFGDLSKVPWWRQPEDDNLPTAAAMAPHRLRRAALHLLPRRSERSSLYFHHGLLVSCHSETWNMYRIAIPAPTIGPGNERLLLRITVTGH